MDLRAHSRVTIAATLARMPSAGGAELASLPAEVNCLEVRADLAGDLDPDWLRARFPGTLLYALRSAASGGAVPGSESDRRDRLIRAAAAHDLVELEGERDLTRELLDAVPPHRRVISWHGGACPASALRSRFDTFSETPARLYRFVSTTGRPGDEIDSLTFLAGLESVCGMHSFLPPELDGRFEDALLACLDGAPPDLVVHVDLNLQDFGSSGFGTDYAQRLGAWVLEHYDAIEQFGPNGYVLVLRRREA